MEEKQKTHVGAYAIIIVNNKIALIKKARGGYKGKYDLPGGGIEHTETPIEALKREVIEEIGVNVLNANLFDVTAANIKWQMTENVIEDLHHIGILSETKIDSNNLKIEADGLDSNGAVWLDINDLSEDMLSPFAWYAIKNKNKITHTNK